MQSYSSVTREHVNSLPDSSFVNLLVLSYIYSKTVDVQICVRYTLFSQSLSSDNGEYRVAYSRISSSSFQYPPAAVPTFTFP